LISTYYKCMTTVKKFISTVLFFSWGHLKIPLFNITCILIKLVSNKFGYLFSNFKFLETTKFLVSILDLKYSNIATLFVPCKISLYVYEYLMLEIILYLWFTIYHFPFFHYWTHHVAKLTEQHHACKTLTRNWNWFWQ
jgi:hypothetical protein